MKKAYGLQRAKDYCSKPLLITIFLASNILNAQDNQEDIEQEYILDEIEITTHRVFAKKSKADSEKIRKNIIINENDLMRDQIGSSVAQGGRSGANGFSIRGVDANRVSIKVDGMEAAQSFAPTFHQKQGFISGVRSTTEIENLADFQIEKGSNSVLAGDGALGGVVSMNTKIAQDFVDFDKEMGFLLKSAYSSKNREWREVLGGGFIVNGFEGLFQYTRRDAHETKTYFSDRIDDKDICGLLYTGKDYDKFCGAGRVLPDPLDYSSNAYLAKFGYRFDDHFVNLFFESKNIKNNIEEKSFPASYSQAFTSDKTPYTRYGMSYEYFPIQSFVEELKIQLARQKTEQIYNQKSYMLRAPSSEIVRNTKTTQKKNQFDFKFNTVDIALSQTYHSIMFGTGLSRSNFENEIFWNQLTQKSKTLDMANYPDLILDTNGFPIIVPRPQGVYEKEIVPSGFGDKIYLKINGERFAAPFDVINGKIYINDGTATYTRPIKTNGVYLYLQDFTQLNDKTSAIIALRYDRIMHKLLKTEKLGTSADTTKAIWDMPNSKTYDAFSYNVGINTEIFDNSFVVYNFSSGFKTPTIQESFVEFRDSKIYKSNFNLKPEKAYNFELGFNTQGRYGAFSILGFYTKYVDYIDYVASDVAQKDPIWGYTTNKLQYQYQNIDNAHIRGVEISAKFHSNFGLFGSLMASWQNGNMSNESSLMAVQPFTSIATIGYEADKYALSLSGKYQADHSGKFYFYDDGNAKKVSDIKLKEISTQSYFVFDLLAEYRVNKNLRINAGIFNLFDRKYIMWDTVRESKNNGTLYIIAQQDEHEGSGLERLSAPGRNFGISIEARF